MENMKNQKVALLILDGWGLSAAWNGNAIKLANPENYNYLWQTYPHWALKTSDQSVEKDNQAIFQGIGYSIISCGRFLASAYSYIQNKIENNEISHSKAIAEAMQNCKTNNSALHLCGLVSENKKLSYFRQIYPVVQLARNIGIKNLYLHLILDNDNLNNMSQISMISEIEKELEKYNLGKIASVSGRNYALDDQANFEKITHTYRAIALGEGRNGLDVNQIIQSNSERNIACQNIPPTVIVESGKPSGKMNDFDSLIFFNFDDRSLRSLAAIFIGQDKAIRRKEVYNIDVVTFSDYYYLGDTGSCKVAFRRNDLKPNIPQLLLENNKTQLYLTSEIKHEHLNYYFMGGDSETLRQVDFKSISSNFSHFGLQQLVGNLTAAIKNKSHDFIVATIGNCDYIAHNSKIKSVADSVKEVDSYLGQIELAATDSGYNLIITSDHGFIEQLANISLDEKIISHTKNPVPAMIINKGKAKKAFSLTGAKDQNLSEILSSNKTLQDVAPTILNIYGIEKPVEMVGNALI